MFSLLFFACAGRPVVAAPDLSGEPDLERVPEASEDGTAAGCSFTTKIYDKEYVTTVLPKVRLVTEPEIEHNHRRASMVVGISSKDGCGEIDVNALFFFVQDDGVNSSEWMSQTDENGVAGILEVEDATTFPPIVASNMNVTPSGDELHYLWTDENSSYHGYGVMPTQHIPANGEVLYRFTWNGMWMVPDDHVLEMALVDVGFTDPATGVAVPFKTFLDQTRTTVSSRRGTE